MRLGLSVVVLISGVSLPLQSQPPGPPGGGRGGVQPERPLVAQFDRDNNRRLDAAERAAAREWLAAQPVQGPGGRGGPPPGARGGGRGYAPGTPGPRVDVRSVRPVPPTVPLYDTGVLRTLFLEFENNDWERELEAFVNTDVEVPATVIVDGKRYPEVGVHFRGASSYFMVPSGSKRSLNLTFDFVDEKQSLLGYRTINLLNVNSDPTFVRTLLYSHVASQYLPAPKTNYARVVINGESWGVFVNVQQFNKEFLADFYGTTNGARWKVPGSRGGMEYIGDDVAQYRRIYDIKSKDNAKSWTALIELFRVLNTTPADKLEAALSPIMDVDGALRFLAIDNALANSDGYWSRASDYNIYQDTSGRFHVLPHDMNEGFMGGGPPPGARSGGPPPDVQRGAVAAPNAIPQMQPGGRGAELDPLVGLDDSTKPLRSRLLAVPALRERYLAYVRDIAEKWLDWNRIDPLVTSWQSLIAAEVAADTRKLYTTEAFTTGLRGEGGLQRFVERRRSYLLERTRERQ